MKAIPLRVRALDTLMRLTMPPVAALRPADFQAMRAAASDLPPWALRPIAGAVAADVDVRDEWITTRGGPLRLRVHSPATPAASPRPVLVFLHGGGWCLGTVEAYLPLCAALAAGADVVVASVDYRLAPEAPAPAGIEDCIDATRWLGEHADRLGGDPHRLGICGDSAGGNLAAVTAQVLRDEGGPALAHQMLIYPAVDWLVLRRSRIEFADGPILPRSDLEAYFRHYLGPTPALDPGDPLISPLFGRLEGLPPALVQTAGLDPLRDEGRAYAEALRAAGVEVSYTEYPQASHGFAGWPGLSRGVGRHRCELVDHARRHLHGRRAGAAPGMGRSAD